MTREKIEVAELHRRLKAQGVSAREHCAVVCPICGTVQSIASLMRAGASAEDAESRAGFSCEGRLTNAGPWPSDNDKSTKAKKRRSVRGCDWTLGGLFQVHRLEVETEKGPVPFFEVATPDQAAALEQALQSEKELT